MPDQAYVFGIAASSAVKVNLIRFLLTQFGQQFLAEYIDDLQSGEEIRADALRDDLFLFTTPQQAPFSFSRSAVGYQFQWHPVFCFEY